MRIARKSGFYKRSTEKLSPELFIDIVLYCACSTEKVSLEQACVEISEMHGIEIKKQSLDERFHQGALNFILSLLSEILQNQLLAEIDPAFLKEFSQVRITDSTKFDIPKSLKELFKGFNGRSIASAGVSIQYEFDIKNGAIINLGLFGATKSDSKYAEEIAGSLQANDLVIRDLGYYSADNLKEINLKGAYFISRLNAKADVYTEDNAGKLTKVCFATLYKEMLEKKLTEQELAVYIGKNKLLPVRLIVNLMPEDIYAKRIRKIERYNKANGHQTSNEIKDRLKFNLFVTNIEAEKMSTTNLAMLYKIRWQIELVFKCWKSHMGIDKIQKMKYERFTTLLYAKLLLILVNHQIINNIRCKFYRSQDKLLSIVKCVKTMREHNNLIRQMVAAPGTLANCMKRIEKMLMSNHWQEKRKNRLGLIEIMQLFNSNTDIYAIFRKETRGNTQKRNPLLINNLSSLLS